MGMDVDKTRLLLDAIFNEKSGPPRKEPAKNSPASLYESVAQYEREALEKVFNLNRKQ